MLLAILGTAAAWSLRLAWADHLSRSPQLATRERAAGLAPWSAAIQERLAEKRDETGADPLPDLAQAAALDPANARRFERLGQRAEFSGDLPLAERSLLRAAELSRLYQPRYLLAQYYFRRRNVPEWDHWSREAFEAAPGDVTPLLDSPGGCARTPLLWSARLCRPNQQWPGNSLLFWARKRHTALAAALARKLAETGGRADLPALLGFCEQSLSDAAVNPAVEVWNILCRRESAAVRRTRPRGPGYQRELRPHAARQRVRLARRGTDDMAIRAAPPRCHLPGELRRCEDTAWEIFYPAGSTWRELPRSTTFKAPADVARLALPQRIPAIRLELLP